MHAGGLGGGDHRAPVGIAARSARCSRRPCRRTARRPAAGSRYGGRAPPASTDRAPRRRAAPRRARAARRRRARAPASTCPSRSGRRRRAPAGLQGEVDVLHDQALRAGRRNARALSNATAVAPEPAARACCAALGMRASSSLEPPPALARRDESPPVARSRDRPAPARAPARIELAMMMPPVASCWITR